MLASTVVLLIVYVVAIFAVSVLGGRLSEFGTMSHRRTQLIVSLVAGFIMGIAVFHLLPHSIEYMQEPHALERVALWIAAGMVTMIILLRVFDFHQHDIGDHDEREHNNKEGPTQASLWAIAFGLGLHTFTEGIALGTSMRIGLSEHGLLPGLGVCLAILLHKPLDAYSITGIMKSRGSTAKSRVLANVGYAIICPLVAIVSYFGTGLLGVVGNEQIIGLTLAFAVGAFLCISLSDLLPEIHFHRHDRFKLLMTLFTGIALAYALYFVEEISVHGGAH